MLTKYGLDNALLMLLIGVLLIVIAIILPRTWYAYIIGIFGIVFFLFTLWFFRDPERKIPELAIKNHNIILAPADGRVVDIKEVEEKNYLKGNSIRISIFLSPLDVHVNRSPVSGIVQFYKYNPGDYLVAYHPKSSELNEQTVIGVETSYGKVLFKQITGILARRIVCDLKPGDTVQAGNRFGMMKFGSRMDIFVHKSTKIYVKVGDKVRAGETIMGELVHPQNAE